LVGEKRPAEWCATWIQNRRVMKNWVHVEVLERDIDGHPEDWSRGEMRVIPGENVGCKLEDAGVGCI